MRIAWFSVLLLACGTPRVCEGPACATTCTDTACEVSGGDRAAVTCSQDCNGAVGVKSSVACGVRATCAFSTGEETSVRCKDAAKCTLTLGEKSSVTCEGFAVCAVTCVGSCALDCRQDAACRCSGDGCVLSCASGQPSTCADGGLECGGC